MLTRAGEHCVGFHNGFVGHRAYRSDRLGDNQPRTIPAGVEGVAEDMKGRAKEAVGAVSGNESLTQEGQAQQDKAAALCDVAESASLISACCGRVLPAWLISH